MYFQDTTEVHLYSFNKTLVVLERSSVENMITSIIKISDFRVSVWNADSLVFVTELDFLDKVQSGESLPRGNVHTEISDIGLNNTHLAV